MQHRMDRAVSHTTPPQRSSSMLKGMFQRNQSHPHKGAQKGRKDRTVSDPVSETHVKKRGLLKGVVKRATGLSPRPRLSDAHDRTEAESPSSDTQRRPSPIVRRPHEQRQSRQLPSPVGDLSNEVHNLEQEAEVGGPAIRGQLSKRSIEDEATPAALRTPAPYSSSDLPEDHIELRSLLREAEDVIDKLTADRLRLLEVLQLMAQEDRSSSDLSQIHSQLIASMRGTPITYQRHTQRTTTPHSAVPQINLQNLFETLINTSRSDSRRSLVNQAMRRRSMGDLRSTSHTRAVSSPPVTRAAGTTSSPTPSKLMLHPVARRLLEMDEVSVDSEGSREGVVLGERTLHRSYDEDSGSLLGAVEAREPTIYEDKDLSPVQDYDLLPATPPKLLLARGQTRPHVPSLRSSIGHIESTVQRHRLQGHRRTPSGHDLPSTERRMRALSAQRDTLQGQLEKLLAKEVSLLEEETRGHERCATLEMRLSQMEELQSEIEIASSPRELAELESAIVEIHASLDEEAANSEDRQLEIETLHNEQRSVQEKLARIEVPMTASQAAAAHELERGLRRQIERLREQLAAMEASDAEQ